MKNVTKPINTECSQPKSLTSNSNSNSNNYSMYEDSVIH
jgi:hypothetical protein